MKSPAVDERQLQREFLPAALAVQQTPPTPMGRWVARLLVALFFFALLWSLIGEVDIVISAPGRVIPSGSVKLVQAPDPGSVSAIYVKNGQRVSRGQPLFQLDQTFTGADSTRIDQQIIDITWRLVWRQAYDRWLAVGAGRRESSGFDVITDPGLRAKASALYTQHCAESEATLRGMEQQLGASEAEQSSLQAERMKIEAVLDIQKQRVGAYRALMQKQYGARLQYLQLLQEQIDMERSLPVLEARQRQLAEAGASLRSRVIATVGDKRKLNLLEMARLDSEKTALEEDAKKARQRHTRQLVRSPVSGTVHELAIHTVGAIVTPAQRLMKVVPEEAVLEVEALVQNKDIGFIHEGQSAELKVETFNFTKYGLVDAKIVDIGKDAVKDERLGWVFNTRLELQTDEIQVAGKMVALSPGMEVTAEVITGKRRLIEYFLSPLLRYSQESVRER